MTSLKRSLIIAMSVLTGMLIQWPMASAKPVAPIAIDYELLNTLRVGQATDIRITVTPQSTLANVVVEFNVTSGLLLGSPASPYRAAVIASDEPLTVIVTVTPMQRDVVYLNVLVEGDINGSRQARGLMIPLRLSAEKTPTPMLLEFEASGQLIHSLPAVGDSVGASVGAASSRE